ncbi:hypothetical protein, partial [Pseudomonas savastanoi]|uniref:hypothetical protein n=1 Tax=Pseudomonas savastanoi TaxID=29438 RepID=UPI001C7FC729
SAQRRAFSFLNLPPDLTQPATERAFLWAREKRLPTGIDAMSYPQVMFTHRDAKQPLNRPSGSNRSLHNLT